MNAVEQACVPHLALFIKEDAVIDGANEILKTIKPHWHIKDVRHKMFTDGITNKLVGCFNQPNQGGVSRGDTSKTFDPDTAVTEDVMLIRVYGNKTDLLIDRRKETENILLMNKYGYAPSIYATFDNGLAYEYVPGTTLTPTSCQEEYIWPLVARRMAQMHKVRPIPLTDERPALVAKMDQFLALIPESFSDAAKDKLVWKVFPRVSELRAEFGDLYAKLQRLNSPVVFCHNDLLLGNVIYDKTRSRVTFIDYEYAGLNHQAFDIGNHFTEFAGVAEIDYSRYPSKDFQMRWLREYLEEFINGETTNTSPIVEADVQRLYVQVNQYALASHFLWAVWALIQAEHSTIDFDFVQFGVIRFTEYRRKKDEFLTLCAD
ncbi:ethanolamine kinase [Anopheles cruzii]|uniref:ethanolamine kinase n=1 Tax=Anopheles cruzii TaxID=68878 RepID=UPI0022EC36D1|nr:ethanolamine kinase [Anopheles cruzii]